MSERGLSPKEAAAKVLFDRLNPAGSTFIKEDAEAAISATMTDKQFERVVEQVNKLSQRMLKSLHHALSKFSVDEPTENVNVETAKPPQNKFGRMKVSRG